ncbi:MAG: hypothetical protein WAK28_20135 [Trebonia sp.]
MAILAGSGANADVAEESAMHPIIEAEIMMTRTRPRRTAGRTRLVWRAAGQGRRALRLLPGLRPWPIRTDNPLRGERAVAGLVLADASRRLG